MPRIALLLLLFLCSCSSSHQKRWEYLHAFHEGKIEKALALSEHLIQKNIGNSEQYKKSNDATWLLLDRGLLHFVSGDGTAAMADFDSALQAMDYYQQNSSAEALAQLATQDEAGAYSPWDYETLLARLYFSFALFDHGDISNAAALLRQAEELQQQFGSKSESELPYYQRNPLAKVLLAHVAMQGGDHSNARILLAQAGDDLAFPPLAPSPGRAQLWVVLHLGSTPYRVSSTCPGSAVPLHLLESILSDAGEKAAACSCTGIPVPALAQWKDQPTRLPQILLNRHSLLWDPPLLYVGAQEAEELQARLPLISARAMARILIRRGLVAAAKERDRDAGALADFAMLIANLSTAADTRQWSTLPSEILVHSETVDPGVHRIEIGDKQVALHLGADDFCLIHIFQPAENNFYIRAPKRFLVTEGDRP